MRRWLLGVVVLALLACPSLIGQAGNTQQVILLDVSHFEPWASNKDAVDKSVARLQTYGYRVRKTTSHIADVALRDVSILYIVNALAERNVDDWSLPAPSAFDGNEIRAIDAWVKAGGALFLAAGHFVLPGGAHDLAAAFGVQFVNGFVVNESMLTEAGDCRAGCGITTCRRSDGTLGDNPITNGRSATERVDSVRIDTGSLISVTGSAVPLLKAPTGFVLLTPSTGWKLIRDPHGTFPFQFGATMQRTQAAGGLQGAALNWGRGRVAVFAAAGVTAPWNTQFMENVLRWLGGSLREQLGVKE